MQVGRQPASFTHRRIDGEHIELGVLCETLWSEARAPCRADLPAGHVEGLAKARHDERACSKARKARRALVLCAIKYHVFVHLVTDEQNVGGSQ